MNYSPDFSQVCDLRPMKDDVRFSSATSREFGEGFRSFSSKFSNEFVGSRALFKLMKLIVNS
jgi:hypothetical protein